MQPCMEEEPDGCSVGRLPIESSRPAATPNPTIPTFVAPLHLPPLDILGRRANENAACKSTAVQQLLDVGFTGNTNVCVGKIV